MSTNTIFKGLPDEPFFMVYGVGQGAPTARHRFREDAEAEAKRLARANPDTSFVVLESVSAVIKREFDTVTFKSSGEDHDDGIPF